MARNKRTLKEIDNEIAKLTAEADAIRAEKAGVIARMKEAVAYYGITAEEMGFSVKRKAKASAKSNGKAKPKAPAATRVRFKDDKGNAWSGYGRKPQWLNDLLASGKTLDDFRV